MFKCHLYKQENRSNGQLTENSGLRTSHVGRPTQSLDGKFALIEKLLDLGNVENRAQCSHSASGVEAAATGGQIENKILLGAIAQQDDIFGALLPCIAVGLIIGHKHVSCSENSEWRMANHIRRYSKL